jgi:hypothetical protein
MPTRMFRTARMVAGVFGAALLLAGCPSSDVDGQDLADALEEAGANRAQAECAADRFDDDLTQDERNEVAQASDEEDVENLDDDVREAYMSIMAECIGGEAPTTTTAEEGTDTSDTSETNTGGEETTTTSAPG